VGGSGVRLERIPVDLCSGGRWQVLGPMNEEDTGRGHVGDQTVRRRGLEDCLLSWAAMETGGTELCWQ
jgi:hypothetical protein